VLSKGSNSEVLSISKQILSRLSQLSSKPFDGEVKDEDSQVLQVDKEILSDGILKFAKVIERAVIDPGQCEVKWSNDKYGRDVINVHIKNRLGRPVDIEKKRISINHPMFGTNRVLFQLGHGSWILQDYDNDMHNPANCERSMRHFLTAVDLIVDGHHIRGSPIQVCTKTQPPPNRR